MNTDEAAQILLIDSLENLLEAIERHHAAWEAWLDTPEIGPSEDMLEAMDDIYRLAGIET